MLPSYRNQPKCKQPQKVLLNNSSDSFGKLPSTNRLPSLFFITVQDKTFQRSLNKHSLKNSLLHSLSFVAPFLINQGLFAREQPHFSRLITQKMMVLTPRSLGIS